MLTFLSENNYKDIETINNTLLSIDLEDIIIETIRKNNVNLTDQQIKQALFFYIYMLVDKNSILNTDYNN